MRISMAAALTALGLTLGLAAFTAQAQKYGGILKSIQRDTPNSLSPHDESGSFVTAWAVGGVYNNVVYFDPLKPIETAETVNPELAQGWSWNADYTAITFTLKPGVKWHDGAPFTAKDVKHTFDVVRDASAQKLRINPRRFWWLNVKDITTSGDHEITFHLGRPQPSLLLMLACGLSPVYPAHVPLPQVRQQAMGTGPFRMVEYKRDVGLKVRKNPEYFIKDRPFLDGVDYIIIKKKATRIAALQSGQVEVNQPNETDQPTYELLKATVPNMAFNKTVVTSNISLLLNVAREPFTDTRIRKAFSLALDRGAFTRSVEPGYIVGAFVLNRPYGSWGLPSGELAGIPGYRDPAVDKEDARRLMRELGYGEARRLKLKVTAQNAADQMPAATWALGELKQIYVDAELEVVEPGAYYPRMARREYLMSVQGMGTPIDDPDNVYFEYFLCGSPRNYTNYCNREAERMFDAQSSTVDPSRRLELVGQIERRLVDEVARISIGFRVNYNARRSYVKNLIGHNTASSWLRMQEVWLDK